jgi:hypothetical protein
VNVYFRKEKEEGIRATTFLLDSIFRTNFINMMAAYSSQEVTMHMNPTWKDYKWLSKQNDGQGLLYSVQEMPWPFSNRELCFILMMVFDHKNKAYIAVSKGLPVGTKYFDTVIPPEKSGTVRIEFNFFFNYFQYVDENTCRCLVMANTDAKIDIFPDWLMSHITQKVLLDNTTSTKKMCEEIGNPGH